MSESITLGILTLTASEQRGGFVAVGITTPSGDGAALALTVSEWHSLQTIVEILALADKRHGNDMLEIQRLDHELAMAKHQRDEWKRRANALGFVEKVDPEYG